jgi:site-specific DNA recombinase
MKLVMKDQYLLYVRKSTESEDRQVASIENQLEVLYQLAKEKGLNVLSTITESRSAKKPGREGFSRLLSSIDQRDDIKGIICWKLNRLSRNPQDSGMLRQMLYDGKIIEIVTPTKTYLEADSDFVMAIEDAQSQKFIRDLREDTKRGIINKLEMGHAPILAPAGYKNDMEKRQGERTISPHPLYYPLVRKIFELALTGRFSTQDLYKKAVQMGIKTNRGRPISRNQMYKVLRNPFYTGRFVYQGVTYLGNHTPMISDPEFNAIQESLAKKGHPRKQKHDFDFRGFIKCGGCGYYWTGETHTKKSGKIFDYYKCCKKGKGCSQPMVSASDVKAQVSGFLNGLTIKKAYVDWCIKWLREAEIQDRAARNKQHTALKIDYTNTVKKVDNLTDRWLSVANEDKSLLSDDEYKRLKQKYLIEKQTIYKRMKNSDKELSEWTDTLIATFNFTVSLQDKWLTGTLEDRRNILTVVGSQITIMDKTLTIKPRSPFRSIQKAISNPVFKAKSGTADFVNPILGG